MFGARASHCRSNSAIQLSGAPVSRVAILSDTRIGHRTDRRTKIV
jgi:hypothetical protein